MTLSTSPRKVIPLSNGEEWRSKSKSLPSITKRAFFCGVIVESPAIGRDYSDDVQDLVASLGVPLEPPPPTPTAERPEADAKQKRQRAMTDSTALKDQINEFVSTERSYVDKLRTLKKDYADPLRQFSRSQATAIIKQYQANTLFANVDSLIPVHEVFLEDLEEMLAGMNDEGKNGSNVGGIGDVALKHFKDYNGFHLYKLYYAKREEAQAIFENEMKRKGSEFPSYIDRMKYSDADVKNRIGLRELLMDPVQRIPRYTMMFRNMIKRMAQDDPQRAKLVEADEIASRIALAELDDETKRGQVMYTLSSAIEGFPPGLISSSRRFIECIDVEDCYCPAGGSAEDIAGAGIEPLKCSLFLFDDKLMIVKRNGDKPVRALSGLNDLNKVLPKPALRPISLKKSGLQFKGIVEITDVVATDVSAAEFHLYLENPPQDVTDRWSGRPFRAFTVVHPPSPTNINPERAESDKKAFLENLWTAQAKYRTKEGLSVVVRSDEEEVENRGGRMTAVNTFYNVYSRTDFMKERRKTKVVVHVDADGVADPIPFGIRGPPMVVIRIQPMAGELSKYVVTSSDSSDEGEEDIVQTDRVPGRIVQTIHQYGLFKFSTGNNSRPSTPTASMRSRAAIFSLDVIGRNLFGQGINIKGDLFGSVSSSRRTKSTRSSVYTDGSLARFSRSNSTTTAATMTVSEGESSLSRSRSTKPPGSKQQKLIKRKSPAPINPEDELPPRSRTNSAPSSSRSRSTDREFTDDDEERLGKIPAPDFDKSGVSDDSEWALTQNLELARRNSKSQNNPIARQRSFLEEPIEETIYEEEPPPSLRSSSRASSKRTHSQRSNTSRTTSSSNTQRPPSPPSRPHSRATSITSEGRHSRSTSLHSSERRPLGPRSPSPLPPKTPTIPDMSLPPADLDLALESAITHMTNIPVTPTRMNSTSSIPRSKRQPFEPTGNTDVTPKAVPLVSGIPRPVEPLAIKKRNSVRSSPGQGRRVSVRNSPLSKPVGKGMSPKRASPRIGKIVQPAKANPVPAVPLPPAVEQAWKNDDLDKLIKLAESTKVDIESSKRAVKRIKLEFDQLKSTVPRVYTPVEDSPRPESPISPLKRATRTPQTPSTPMTREAQQRMNEMRQMIGRRNDVTPRKSRPVIDTSEKPPPLPTSTASEPLRLDGLDKAIETFVFDVDGKLAQAAESQDAVQEGLREVSAKLRERALEHERVKIELQSIRRQCEVVKNLLADATAEKEIMYEAFNEELDSMYNDVQLPGDEAWTALTTDLQQTKQARNDLSKENAQLKLQLSEAERQKEEWGALLRAHGLIS